jgi:hypothetical protein
LWLVRSVRVGRLIFSVVLMGYLGWLLYTTRETVSCSYAGPPRNVLTITLKNAGGELRRAGGQIIVAKDDGSQVFCSGGTPTVRNTDTIRAKLGDIDSLELWLGNGPLEPGATAERDGRSEIEIVASGVDASLDVVGTPADETWQWGPGREQPGLNLDAGRSGDRDVDVTITGAGSSISGDAAGGNDRVGAGPSVDIAADAFADVSGGSGDDVLRAPRDSEGDISGGPGDDTITGGQRPDDIYGDAGDDVIDVRDDARDTVDCGPGRDRVRADPRDRLRGCEIVRRR